MLKSSYKNVAQVLADEGLATAMAGSEQEEVDAIRSRLKELGINGSSTGGTRYLVYVFWMFVFLEALTSYYVIPLIILPVMYRVLKVSIQYSFSVHFQVKFSSTFSSVSVIQLRLFG